MRSWRLNDDIDLEDFRGSWLSHPSNSEFLEGAELALLQHIQSMPELRAMFLTEGIDGSMILCPAAMAIYESNAQEFLKRALVLSHIPSGQPLREPELLSVTWCNTARQRHLLVWEKLVMILYSVSQRPAAVGAYTRIMSASYQRQLGISFSITLRMPYHCDRYSCASRLQVPLSLHISGRNWTARCGLMGTLSAYLSKACARAQVPRLHTSNNWRQISASVVKEKFSNK
jgi:hypothetical protein